MSTQIINQTTRATEKLRGGVYTGDPAGTPHGGNVTAAFPRPGTKGDARDELLRQKMEFVAAAGGDPSASPLGLITATEEDFRTVARKREQEAEFNYDAWVNNNFHTHDVVGRRWLQQVDPNFYDKRERLMVDRAKFALRVKLLLLRGPKNHKDLVLMWGLQTGAIQLDRDWDKIGPSEDTVDMDVEQNRFKGGLLTPARYLSDDQRARNAQGTNFDGSVGYNPFAPNGWDAGNGQNPSPFYGGAVPTRGLYPAFLQGAITNATNGAGAGVGAGVGGGGGGRGAGVPPGSGVNYFPASNSSTEEDADDRELRENWNRRVNEGGRPAWIFGNRN